MVFVLLRAKEAEVAAIAESASQSSRGESEAHKAAAKAQASSQRLEADVQRLQRHITHLKASNRCAWHHSNWYWTSE